MIYETLRKKNIWGFWCVIFATYILGVCEQENHNLKELSSVIINNNNNIFIYIAQGYIHFYALHNSWPSPNTKYILKVLQTLKSTMKLKPYCWEVHKFKSK